MQHSSARSTAHRDVDQDGVAVGQGGGVGEGEGARVGRRPNLGRRPRPRHAAMIDWTNGSQADALGHDNMTHTLLSVACTATHIMCI